MVNIYRIPFGQTNSFARTDVDYVNEVQALRDFYKYPVNPDAISKVIHDKANDDTDRAILVQVLKEQYANLNQSERAIGDLINTNHFTITTAHQPVLLTGPLYVIYKICSAIHMARLLRNRYPDHGFHPVLVMGGEDHDFEEIQKAYLFGKEVIWEDPKGGKGAVGRMSTEKLNPVLETVKDILGDSSEAGALKGMLQEAFTNDRTYGEAMQCFFIQLFKNTGLIVLNMDHPRLKARFLPVLKRELLQRPSIHLIEKEQKKLEKLGYKPQALAREINLFYLTDEFRERIEWNGDRFEIINRDMSFSEEEMIEELESHPERFSPNVCLRPVYQEYILPNLAYVGGGGEIAYWLERKSQFEKFEINFPMLIRRNSVLWIDNKLSKDMREVDLDIRDLFEPTDALINRWIHANAGSTIEYEEELKRIEKAFISLSEKARVLDPTLKKAIEAEKVRQLKSVEQLGKRLLRAEKSNHERSVNKIRKIRDKLFPDQTLQERHDNFIPFYLKYGRQFIDILLRELSPFEKGLIIVEDHE